MKSFQLLGLGRSAERFTHNYCVLAVICVVTLAFGPLTARAQPRTVIVPSGLVTQEMAYAGWTLVASNLHVQEVYAAKHFPTAPMLITELRFRPNAAYGKPFTNVVQHIQINLSTANRLPDLLEPRFTDNVGPDDTVVFSGALAVSSKFTGPAAGPKDFDILVPLTTPFLYNPVAGDLLVEIRNFSGSAATYLSGQVLIKDGASRVIGSTHVEKGNAESGIDALQVVYWPSMAPPPLVRLVRGPYLQTGTPTSMVVRWRTRGPSDSRVLFGATTNDLTSHVDDETLTTEHIVTLTNLAPGTKYYYRVGSTTTNLPAGPDFFFYTSPQTRKPTRIWALGDSGTSTQLGETGQLQVRDSYYSFAKGRHTDVWLMLGDNAYYEGLDDEYQVAVFDMYRQDLRTTPLWPTLGNHDALSGDYFDIFSFPLKGEAGGIASGTKAYYSFDYGNIHFVCLDSESSSRSRGSPMLSWLAQDLAANNHDWTIAFWHQPPYTKGSHDSDVDFIPTEMRENVVPILETYGVDLVLCGHSHNYERSFFLNGHFGRSDSLSPTMVMDRGSGRIEESGPYLKSSGPTSNSGTVYVVAGSSGWADLSPLNHPAMFADPAWGGTRGLSQLGSMVIDIDGNRLDARFLRETGAIDDHFTIIKGTAPASLRLVTLRIRDGRLTAQWKSGAGRRYQLEKSPSLENAIWSPISPPVTATGATTEWSGPVPGGASRMFFRVNDLGQ